MHQKVIEYSREQQAFYERVQRFREFTDLLPLALFEMDLNSNFTYANRFALESFGYTQRDIDDGLDILELFAPDDHSRVIENVQQILAGIDIENHEYTLHKKDGTTIQVLIYSAPIIQNDTVTGLRGVVLDITERKRMEEALRESEEKLRTIFENVTDEIVYVDESGTVIDVNNRIEDIFGYTPEGVIGKNFFDIGYLDRSRCKM